MQPTCRFTERVNLVSCANWQPSLTVTVSAAFVPGDYLLKLIGADGEQNYVPLTVWDPTSHAAYLVKNDVYTWQAWNAYGGYDFYAGKSGCSGGSYPTCVRARIVSFDRPYAYGHGAGDFLGNEYPFVRFAEQYGLDVSYATDLTIEQHPDVLLRHKALMSLGHDECWSRPERVAVQSAETAGLNIAFFAASPVLRHVRMEPSPLGPGREEVDYRDSAADPLDGRGDPRDVTGNTWSDPPANWSEVPFVGAKYAGYLQGAHTADLRVADGTSWIFAGTGLGTGAVLPDLLHSDFDEFDPGQHAPTEQILAHSPIRHQVVQTNVRSRRGYVYADMTYYTDPASGAGVFDSGTNSWIPSLADTPNTAAVAAITGNLLRVMGEAPAGRVQPSIPNWSQFYGR
jgi:hypothetical protein